MAFCSRILITSSLASVVMHSAPLKTDTSKKIGLELQFLHYVLDFCLDTSSSLDDIF